MITPSPGIAFGLFILFTLNFLFARAAEISVRSIFLLGLGARLLVLLLPNYLSSDIYRYLWEGHLLRNGLSPYLYSPDSSNLTKLHTDYWELIEHKHLSAIYPPFSQALFTLFAFTEWSWRAFLLCVEIGTFFTLKKILEHKQLSPQNIALYWLLPLPIIEIVWSGHLEGALVFLFALLWLVLLRQSKHAALLTGLLLALASLVKYNAVFLAPFLAVYFFKRSLQDTLRFCTLFVAAIAVGLLPFLDISLSMFSSLFVYLEHWRFNDSLLHVVGSITGVNWQDSRSFVPVKLALTSLWGALLIWRSFAERSFSLFAVTIFMGFLLVSSVVHPWYLLWFAPFLVARHSNAALLFCLLAPISYLAFGSGRDLEVGFKVIEYLPVYLLLIFELHSYLKRRA